MDEVGGWTPARTGTDAVQVLAAPQQELDGVVGTDDLAERLVEGKAPSETALLLPAVGMDKSGGGPGHCG